MHIHKAMIALTQSEGLGPVLIRRLLAAVNNRPEEIWKQSKQNLLRIRGIGKKHINSLDNVDWSQVEKEYQSIQQKNITMVACCQSHYPESLHHLHDPPAMLYTKGNLLPQDKKGIAIVGTRRASYYGKRQAYRFARELAERGITVVSGLARGIDVAAHQGALAAGGRTLAVLGHGLNTIYPKEHHNIACNIAAHGTVISEYSLDIPPLAANFPRRNRIISGLVLGVIIVEALSKSGALITAQYALEQGREVFAVPGNIDNPLSCGPHRLIQQGAKLVIDVDDILEEFTDLRPMIDQPRRTIVLNESEKEIWAKLSDEPVSIEVLGEDVSLAPSQVSSCLLLMEMKGLVAVFPGKRYAKVAGTITQDG